MPKHQTSSPALQELYDVVRDCPGVSAIDGRSSSILYVANVPTLKGIVDCLVEKYGLPTKNDPLLNSIEWRLRDDYRIHIDKASDMSREGTLHHLYGWAF